MSRLEERFGNMVIATGAFVLLVLVVLLLSNVGSLIAGGDAAAERGCLEGGYSDYRKTVVGGIGGEAVYYCIRLENGTEVVVPLESLERGR